MCHRPLLFQPTLINKNSTTLKFTYGADLSRALQVKTVDGTVTKTYYAGKHYELEVKGGKETSKTYVSDIAIISNSQENGVRIDFTHRDRLGSATSFTDHNGKLTAVRSYDPFGKPRGGDWSTLSIPQMSQNTLDPKFDEIGRRGFTDHEHLDEVELIHMNGRVYDYNLGRFMSVDPIIQGSEVRELTPIRTL